MENAPKKSKRILAVSSGGGHWVQLRRLSSAFDGHDVTYATVSKNYESDVRGARFFAIRDGTRWDKWALIVMMLQILWILIRIRPHVVVSTGAAPGYFALTLGKLFRARTIWLDSMANVEELSMSGKKAGRFADLWLTQWPHLARPEGPQFRGEVL
ncbi:MAG: UDP-N-acetylglucosamine--LPS N-acetylglucosamine transferase [Planctomycetota bacterium]